MIRMNNKINEICSYFDTIYSNPKCELLYNKDYELLIAVMLSAQCTDKRVNMVTRELFDKYTTIDELANAKKEDIIRIVKPVGTFNKKSVFVKQIAISLVKFHGGVVPNDRTYLESLPGVGRKTTNVVLGLLYNVPCIPVDTHVSRVSKRLDLVSENDDVEVIEKKLMKLFPINNWIKIHYQMVLFGRYKCKSQKPDCMDCKLKKHCKRFL